MAKKVGWIIAFWVFVLGGFCGWAEGQGPPSASPGLEKGTGGIAPAPAVVMVYNRPIITFRVNLLGSSPKERARAAENRINALIEKGRIGKVSTKSTSEGTLFLIGDVAVLLFSSGDMDPLSGETLGQVAENVTKNLTVALDEAREARSLPLLLRDAGHTALTTVGFLVFLWGLIRGYRRLRNRLEILERRHLGKIHLEGITLLDTEQIILFTSFLVRILAWALALIAGYSWLSYSLQRFPFTRAWGEGLGSFLFLTVQKVILSVVGALPGIFILVLIFFLTRFVTRLIKASFFPLEKGYAKGRWVDMDTAVMTRRILVTIIWLFALVMMYPYIPGSSSDAFKGIGIFVGLVASLGSTALVGQAASGLVLTYSRAFRPGEYVRIGDTEGMVLSLGILSTKIRTPKEEEITIPNAGLIGANIKNFSRLAGKEGVILHTTVTIGYSTPWRQVHEMLLMAADRTPGLKKEPRPFVYQTALSDFYVEYQLNSHLERPENRIPTLAELHAHIQDAFNEFGVQIMSPHYRFDPPEKVWVPREKWFEAPAKPLESTKNRNESRRKWRSGSNLPFSRRLRKAYIHEVKSFRRRRKSSLLKAFWTPPSPERRDCQVFQHAAEIWNPDSRRRKIFRIPHSEFRIEFGFSLYFV
jgi:small-conductance mechanosensitive channel